MPTLAPGKPEDARRIADEMDRLAEQLERDRDVPRTVEEWQKRLRRERALGCKALLESRPSIAPLLASPRCQLSTAALDRAGGSISEWVHGHPSAARELVDGRSTDPSPSDALGRGRGEPTDDSFRRAGGKRWPSGHGPDT
jgi:hypothetical protein